MYLYDIVVSDLYARSLKGSTEEELGAGVEMPIERKTAPTDAAARLR